MHPLLDKIGCSGHPCSAQIVDDRARLSVGRVTAFLRMNGFNLFGIIGRAQRGVDVIDPARRALPRLKTQRVHLRDIAGEVGDLDPRLALWSRSELVSDLPGAARAFLAAKLDGELERVPINSIHRVCCLPAASSSRSSFRSAAPPSTAPDRPELKDSILLSVVTARIAACQTGNHGLGRSSMT